ncbi:MAG: restriction endonuclease subunit S [Bacteroidota bacterium]|nr:restriction endonuclease subunit S [Bacteroidota bacterium]
MSLAKYDKYKPSEIDLLDEIPKDWKVSRLKALGDIRYGLGQPPKQMENGLPIIRATNVSCGKITTKDMLFVDPNDLPYNRKPILKTNEIIVVRSGAYTGDSAIIPEEYAGSVTGYDMVFTPKYINPKFIAFSILSNYIFKDQLVISSLRAAQPHLNKEELGNTLVSIPPVPEQIAIATYLDSKTSAIDRKVSLLEQKITHYQQLRKSLINETVCRGLDKNVKLKDSGIEWIGEIPKHWKIERLKDICGFINRGSSPNYVETGSHKVVNQATFSKGFWDESSLRFTQNFEVKPRGLLKEDDILIASTGGGVLGKVYFFNRKESDYIADSHITILRDTRKSYFSKYVYYYFSEKFKLINDILAQGSTNQTELQRDWLLAFFICIPPQAEQTAIANYLDEKTQMIDSIVSNIKTQIGTLKELRKTLINDVVTGKIKVSEL